jgi:hypothetical protein
MVTMAIGVSRFLAEIQPPTAEDRASRRCVARANSDDVAHN